MCVTLKPTSIIYLILSIILIATGYVGMNMATTLAESEGTSLYSVETDEDGNRINTLTYSSQDYDRVEINVTKATVYLCVGNEEKIVLKNYTEGSFTPSENGVSFVLSDNMSAMDMITSGTFNLSFKGLRHYWHDREILQKDKEVYIYTTPYTELNGIDVVLGEGNVIIEDYEAKFDVMAHADAGSITVKDSSAAAFNLTGGRCKVSVSGATAPSLHSTVSNGNVTVSNSDISSVIMINIKESGNAELSLTRPQSEYVITGEALRGVSINGKSFGSHYPQRDPDSADTGNNGAGNSPIFGSDDSEGSITVKITAASGTATITTNENAITTEGEVQTRNE